MRRTKITKRQLLNFELSLPKPVKDAPEEIITALTKAPYYSDKSRSPWRKHERKLIEFGNLWLPYPVSRGGIAEMPIGGYFVGFAIRLEMERRWRFGEFLEGLLIWARGVDNFDRDSNPYDGKGIDRAESWDSGYMIGHAFVYRIKEGGDAK